MVNTSGLSHDLIVAPGETLKEALSERSITQKELAERTGRTVAYINKVLEGDPITPDFAKNLEYALNIPAYFWNNLQQNYDQELASL